MGEIDKRYWDENDISYHIRGSIFKVYNELGTGLFESVYEAALLYQLKKDGLEVKSQVPVEVYYDGQKLDVGFRLDLLVENKVIVEIKSIEDFSNVHHKQVINYLRLTNLKLGLLVNFNADDIRENILRKVNPKNRL
jgi:GxxExxY protein